jgi:hypothetical protein
MSSSLDQKFFCLFYKELHNISIELFHAPCYIIAADFILTVDKKTALFLYRSLSLLRIFMKLCLI